MSSDSESNIDVDPQLLKKLQMEQDGDPSANEYFDGDTQTLASSIHNFIFENGRRYHAYYGRDKNLLPIDEAEKDRLDLCHEFYRLLLKERLFIAPITAPRRVLDVGTGTGIWAVDMADLFPDAEIVGVDLSPIQPIYVPPNCTFECDDIEQDWTYEADYFDFIHARNISQGIGDWGKLMSEIKRALKRGGWVELAEAGCLPFSDDGTVKPDDANFECCEKLQEAMIKIGRPFPTPGRLKQSLEEAGYVDVKEYRFKQVIGPWPKSKRLKMAGAMCMISSGTGIEAYCLAAFTRILGMDPVEAGQLIERAVKALRDPNIHAWTEYFIAYGRKP